MTLLISGEIGIVIATGNYRGSPFHPAFLILLVDWGNGRPAANDHEEHRS